MNPARENQNDMKDMNGSNGVKDAGKRQAAKAVHLASSLLVALAVLLALAIAGPRLLGYKAYSVLSGSMEPAYAVGSLIYVQPAKAEAIRVGDPITFSSGNSQIAVTHRVVRIDAERRYFFTKGDANGNEDANPVAFAQLIGRPAMQLPYLGYIVAWVVTSRGKTVAIFFLALLIVCFAGPDLVRWIRGSRDADEHAQTDKQDDLEMKEHG